MVSGLVDQVKALPNKPSKVIVIDSSDSENEELRKDHEVEYHRSPLKNQPFQRYLGSKQSSAEYLLFFDDDLSIIDPEIFEKYQKLIAMPDFVGGGVGIDYQTNIPTFFAGNLNVSGPLKRLYYWLLQIRIPEPGKIGFLGVTGGWPSERGEIGFLLGPNMLVNKRLFDEIIDYGMLYGFQEKILMGEDKAISLKLQKFGKLYFDPHLCLKHPPNDSSYFTHQVSFYAKTLYSRYFLSKEVFRLKRGSSFMLNSKYLFFFWNLYWISFLKLVLMPNKLNLQKFKGQNRSIGLFLKYGSLLEGNKRVREFRSKSSKYLGT